MRDDGTRSAGECLWYEAARSIVFMTLLLGWKYRTHGSVNVPRKGPVLFLSGHISHVDPCLVGVGTRRRLVFLARHDLFHIPVIGRAIASLGAVPIKRSVGTEGIKAGRKVLGAGNALLVFPEGTRSPDGNLQPLKEGCTLLFTVPGLQIVPVGVAGSNVMWPKGRWPERWSPLWTKRDAASLAVSYGKPIAAATLIAEDRTASMARITDAIRHETGIARRMIG